MVSCVCITSMRATSVRSLTATWRSRTDAAKFDFVGYRIHALRMYHYYSHRANVLTIDPRIPALSDMTS